MWFQAELLEMKVPDAPPRGDDGHRAMPIEEACARRQPSGVFACALAAPSLGAGAVSRATHEDRMLPELLPTSPASERNKGPLLDALRDVLPRDCFVVEIGSKTGQHADHFTAHEPGWRWQPTDRAHELDGARARYAAAGRPNLLAPIAFDLMDDAPPASQADAVFCANVIHIAPWALTPRLFHHAAAMLKPGGLLCLYGPMRDTRWPLEPSNAEFDAWLSSQDPAQGLRLFQDVDAIARAHGFTLSIERAMPANNRFICWKKD